LYASPNLNPTSLTLSFSSTHPPPTEIYTLSLHDALPILAEMERLADARHELEEVRLLARCRGSWLLQVDRNHLGDSSRPRRHDQDRKSTRLNSSHVSISYAVFCLKKKKKK